MWIKIAYGYVLSLQQLEVLCTKVLRHKNQPIKLRIDEDYRINERDYERIAYCISQAGFECSYNIMNERVFVSYESRIIIISVDSEPISLAEILASLKKPTLEQTIELNKFLGDVLSKEQIKTDQLDLIMFPTDD